MKSNRTGRRRIPMEHSAQAGPWALHSSDRMRAIIVGGGVVGLSTAWQLARRGCEVVVLERFRLGHVRGTSHGETRITRSAYPDRLWVELAAQANHEDWPRLEREAGVT